MPYPTPKLLSLKDALQMVLKCADIGHLAAAPKTHKRWAHKLEEEFFRQVIYAAAYQKHAWHSCSENVATHSRAQHCKP